MSDNTLSVLSIQLEAKQAKLDQDLDRAENKAKESGKKMEGSLSLSNVADGMVKVFAALGTIEAGFKGLTAVTQLFSGDMSSALDTLEQLPFGMGPAIAAGRDFFEVISGSRQEAERLAAEWAKVAESIRTSQAEIDKLAASQREAGMSGMDRINETIAETNELNRRLNEIRNNTIQAQEEGYEFIGPKSVEFLKTVGIEARTTEEAIEKLTAKIEENVKVIAQARADEYEKAMGRIAAIEDEMTLERFGAQGERFDSDIAAKRFQAQIDMEQKLAAASEELERDKIREQFELRMRLLDEELAARRKGEQDAADLAKRREQDAQRQRDNADAERAQREAEAAAERQKREMEQAERDRFVESAGFGVSEFMRTSFEGGSTTPTEVEVPKVIDGLGVVNATLKAIETAVKQQRAVLQ